MAEPSDASEDADKLERQYNGLLDNVQDPAGYIVLTELKILERRACRRFGSTSTLYLEVRGQVNAGFDAVGRGFVEAAQIALKRATDTLNGHILLINRVNYIFGLIIGFLCSGLLTWGLSQVSRILQANVPAAEILIPIFAFAGMGTFVSVFTRLKSLELGDDFNRWLVILSGGARPLIAIFFSCVVFVILSHQMIPVRIGPTTMPVTEYQPSVCLVAAFLCGFSERFASDLISSLPFSKVPDQPVLKETE